MPREKTDDSEELGSTLFFNTFALDLGVSICLRPSFGEAGHSNFG